MKTQPMKYPAKKTLEALFIQSEAALGEDAASEELLSGILAACKLNSNNSVVIKASREHPITVQSTQENYTTKKIILFGLRPTEVGLPVEFPHFQVQKIDSIQFICSPDLKELLQDKTLKVKIVEFSQANFCLMKKLIFASNNAHKAKEIRALLGNIFEIYYTERGRH